MPNNIKRLKLTEGLKKGIKRTQSVSEYIHLVPMNLAITLKTEKCLRLKEINIWLQKTNFAFISALRRGITE